MRAVSDQPAGGTVPLLEEIRTRVDGYDVRAAAGIGDAAAAARELLAAVKTLRPEVGEAAFRARLESKGKALRWRSYRAAFLLFESFAGPIHVKIYSSKGFLDALIEAATRARSMTSWRLGRKFLEAGVPTPEPLLLLSRTHSPIYRESILVTRAIESASELTELLKARKKAGSSLRDLMSDAATLAADFHRAGFFHGDFTSWNLLMGGAADRRQLLLIDLDRAKDVRLLPLLFRRRLQALDVRLLLLTTWGEVSRREWLRFLAVYGRHSSFSRAQRKAFARRILSARRGIVRIGARAPTILGRDPWAPRR